MVLALFPIGAQERHRRQLVIRNLLDPHLDTMLEEWKRSPCRSSATTFKRLQETGRGAYEASESQMKKETTIDAHTTSQTDQPNKRSVR